MKRWLTIPLFVMLAVCAAAQQGQLKQINITSFQVKNNLPPDIHAWATTPGSLLLVAQRVPQQHFFKASLQLQLRRGGTVVCQGRIAADSFNTRQFGPAELAAALRDCPRLTEGAYQLTARFFNIDRLPISIELSRNFIIKNDAASGTERPQIMQPANGEQVKPAQAKAMVMKWKMIAAPPQTDVIYRIRIWTVEKGQQPLQVTRSGKPFFEKEIANQNQLIATQLDKACKTPGCSFAWTVEAIAGGRQLAISDMGLFSLNNNIDIQIDSVHVSCCLNGQQNIFLKVRNNLNSPVTITSISYKINGVGASIPLTPLTPVVPLFMPGLAVQNFTSTRPCIPNTTSLKFLVSAEDPADPDNTETEVSTYTLNCFNDTCCQGVVIEPVLSGPITWNAANQVVLPLNLTVTPGLVKEVKAELAYFQYNPQSDDCIICNKDSKTFGNFVMATVNGGPIGLPQPHTAQWQSPVAAGQNVLNLPFQFTISTPPTVSCCNATVKWCIRYVVTFADCKVCTRLVCYSFTKTGCNQ